MAIECATVGAADSSTGGQIGSMVFHCYSIDGNRLVTATVYRMEQMLVEDTAGAHWQLITNANPNESSLFHIHFHTVAAYPDLMQPIQSVNPLDSDEAFAAEI